MERSSEWIDRYLGCLIFFREKRAASLPTPAQIRALNEKNGRAVSFDWPPPVRIEALGVFVKYGTRVTVAETQAQIWIREELQGRVPIPEVFGWTRDGRNLRQEEGTCYIGNLHTQPLTDIFFTLNEQVMGPFQGVDAVKQFQDTLGIDVVNPGPVVFTHNDLVACNILVGRNSSNIAAIIDWGQAGWYPAYWEYCKARYINVPDKCFINDYEQEWKQEYLPQIISPVDEVKVWYPFLRFAMPKT
ncbi:hypothetical protein GQX73_g10769 [Xylaria multiplex]|uniref:Aminoglycoside phosphotransferase domain-containing protein n=1 Tax=Xylaria multiplex TaxID=323545 RepID=A0A7C8INY1_9PEZI|nr:hypothetical protein GQX73_g10769 [Xylaria multiplex]